MTTGRKTHLNNRGVTLVELLIYLGLSMMIMVVLSELFVSILDESVESQNYSATQTDGMYILTKLSNHINMASSVTEPAGPGDSSHVLQITVNGTLYRYYLGEEKVGEGRVYVHDSSDDHDYLISHADSVISALTFTRVGNVGGKPVILIEFVSSTGSTGTAQYETQTFKGAGGLR